MGEDRESMKNRISVKIVVCILIISLLPILAGCKKCNDNAAAMNALKDRLQENAKEAVNLSADERKEETVTGDDPVEEHPDEQVLEEKTETDAEVIPQLSGLYVTDRDDLFRWDEAEPVRLDRYQTFHITQEFQERYPELATKLLVVNDLIATEEGNSHMVAVRSLSALSNQEMQERMDQGTLPEEESWRIYLRRADEEIVSILCRRTVAGYFDSDLEDFTAYNVHTATGEEVALSELVKDEDELCKLLGKKAADLFLPDLEQVNEEGLAQDFKEYLHEDKLSWTLEAQGVTFWLDAYTAMQWAGSVTILFAEDPDKKIFTDAFASHIPGNWVMEIPDGFMNGFDAEDDGRSDELIVSEEYGYDGENGGRVSGINLLYNERRTQVHLDINDSRGPLTLLHRNGSTLLLEEHDEYDDHLMTLYALNDKGITRTDTINGIVQMLPYEQWPSGAYIAPRQIPTDPDNLVLTFFLKESAVGYEDCPYEISEEGKWVRKGP